MRGASRWLDARVGERVAATRATPASPPRSPPPRTCGTWTIPSPCEVVRLASCHGCAGLLDGSADAARFLLPAGSAGAVRVDAEHPPGVAERGDHHGEAGLRPLDGHEPCPGLHLRPEGREVGLGVAGGV